MARLVTFGSTHHGTTLLGMATLGRAINNHPNLVCAFNPWFIGGGGGI